MITAFSVRLRAISPQHRAWRSYMVEAGRDLFGTWIVEVSFGRIGAVGRTRQYAVADEDEARRVAARCLRRRRSAPRRIGVPYTVVGIEDAAGWRISPLT